MPILLPDEHLIVGLLCVLQIVLNLAEPRVLVLPDTEGYCWVDHFVYGTPRFEILHEAFSLGGNQHLFAFNFW